MGAQLSLKKLPRSGSMSTILYCSTVPMFESVAWPAQPTDKALAANAKEQYWRSNASPFILLIKKHSEQRAPVLRLPVNSMETVHDSSSQHVVWTLKLNVWTLAEAKPSSQRVSKRGIEALLSFDHSRF